MPPPSSTANPAVQLLGIDRDPAALEAAGAALARFGDRAVLRRARFDELGAIVRRTQAELGTPPELLGLSGVLFDLGVSSPQLDTAERGFSYRRDAPLDMRMDPTSGLTAADVVNGYDEDALVALFVDNGEGRFARRIARAIVAARPLTTTGELADVVRAAIPAATRRTGGHPARRVFQAIRIAVNEELEQLDRALADALALLRPGGRCVVISYHSGEDRLVKSTFVQAATGGCTCPPGLPCACGAVVDYRLVARGSRRPRDRGGRPEPPLGGCPPPGHRATRCRPGRCRLQRRGRLMAPSTATAAAATPRRSAARTAPASAPRRPPLRLFEPTPRRRPRARRRPTVLVAGILVVGSLLSVVVADGLVAQEQVSVATTQSRLAAAETLQKQLQVAVAQQSAPQIVVSEAKQLGLVAPPQVVDIPHVPLDVALPAPDTTPLPAPPAPATPASTTPATSATPPTTR